MTMEEIIALVAELLGGYQGDGRPLHILEGGVRFEAGVRHEDDWWHVPVYPDSPILEQWRYYEFLASVEEQIEDQNELNILLVPVAAA